MECAGQGRTGGGGWAAGDLEEAQASLGTMTAWQMESYDGSREMCLRVHLPFISTAAEVMDPTSTHHGTFARVR